MLSRFATGRCRGWREIPSKVGCEAEGKGLEWRRTPPRAKGAFHGQNEHRLPDPRSEELCALVAKQLVRRRKDAEWSQEELATRLGLSRQSVSK